MVVIRQRPETDFVTLTKAPAHEFSKESLEALGNAMIKAGPRNGNSQTPAAFVYFGQFITHDLTRLKGGDADPDVGHQTHVKDLTQLETATLDLTSVYGHGWDDERCAIDKSSGKLCLGETIATSSFSAERSDLPRDKNLKARIPDDRNDENLLLAQMHVLFLKLHNLVIDKLDSESTRDPESAFDAARQEVTRIYQEIILHDFLPALTQSEILDFILHRPESAHELHKINEIRAYTPQFALPVEFNVAAFRFGHSMIRSSYELVRRRRESFAVAELFSLTGRHDPPLIDKRGDQKDGLPSNCVVEWRRDMFGDPKGLSELLDPFIKVKAAPVDDGQESNLAIRNLVRGNKCFLPSAQQLIDALRLERPWTRGLVQRLPPEKLGLRTILGSNLQIAGYLEHNTPLWYYVLQEAKEQGEGSKLGSLGSLIVASTIIEVLRETSESIFRPCESPVLERKKRSDGRYFKLIDMVELVQPQG